ncbi:hypothetical protein LZ009_09275 [Ramlibacter sp. XY19]|uniref:hypothetical protein n=1 Tax=Ramlibacter paludis TaxID=2908000 RepID=UPI0023DCAD4B|nr:hypothetical protein [Ramlibacter paludis]MCG2592970.1 hypothetical protein [Ramlibacter paludis]
MKRTVTFHALSLISERDGNARRVAFSPHKNLLVGPNESGKSRVLKHAVWALGCEPRRAAGDWDSNVVAALELSVGAKRYTFVRQGMRMRAAFDHDGKLLFATESGARWAEFFAETFEYTLRLQGQKEGSYGFAGPNYAVLPYYIDQEGGWGLKWDNFGYLTAFVGWEKPVFESFTGLRPLRYYEAGLRKNEIAFKLKEARSQDRLQERSFKQVTALLPPADATLDESLFAQDLQELAQRVTELTRDEEELRTALVDVAMTRQEKHSQLKMAARSEQALVDDLAYLSRYPDDTGVECPTCGQLHKTSFAARIELAGDAQDAHQLVLAVREQIESLRTKEAELQAKLRNVRAGLERVRQSLSRKHESKTVLDVVAAKSRDTLELAYNSSRRDIRAQIDALQEEQEELDAELAKFTDKGREDRVRARYKEELLSYADRLGVNPSEVARLSIGARPRLAQGSSGPRVYLSMYMALIATAESTGDSPRLPFIVDSPRQQDLGDENFADVLTTIFEQSKAHQIFVANVSQPPGWQKPDDCEVLRFEGKRALLKEDSFREVAQGVGPLVKAMRDELERQREAQAAEEQASDYESREGSETAENSDE